MRNAIARPQISAAELVVRNALDAWDAPDPAYPVFLIDTSHWTGLVNWELYHARGGVAAILKAMDGKSVDSQFKVNYRAATQAGVLVSTYQWLYGARAVSPGGQAREYAALLKDFPPDFSPFVDFEPYPPNLKSSPKADDLESHVGPFEEAFGSKPGIYTGYYYWREAGSTNAKWKDYALWIARYEAAQPLIPAPWEDWTFWQFTESADGEYWGSPPDGERGIDMNYFNGSYEAFLKFCNLTKPPAPPPPPPPTEPPNQGQGVVTASVLNIRSGPGVEFADIGDLHLGDAVQGDRLQGVWLHLQKVKWQPVTTESWCHSGWINFTTPPPPPPPPTVPPNDGLGFVTTQVLNIRSGPGSEFTDIGNLVEGDVVKGDRLQGNWLHLQEVNGTAVTTESWCDSTWIDFSTPPPPEPPVIETRPLFGGLATYSKVKIRGVTYHLVRVDRTHATVLITPQGRKLGVSTTEYFLKVNQLQLAINGDGFSYRKKGGGYEIVPAGFAASRGRDYGKLGVEQTIFIGRDGAFSLEKPRRNADIWDAISFPNLLVNKGAVVWDRPTEPAPRTLLGWSQDQKTIIMVVVDGRELDHTGMRLAACAQLLQQEGAWVGVNMDGGGSSTMVIDEGAGPVVLNVPSDDNTFGKQRAVLNHFGLYVE